MIPHIQTTKNDCFRTCVEAILEEPLASCPNFCAWEGDDWFQCTAKWLSQYTKADDLLRVAIQDGERIYQSGLDLLDGIGIKDVEKSQMCLVIQDVMTPRGLKHSIVSNATLTDKIVKVNKLHDPHPEAGPTWPENGEIISFYAIVSKGLWVV